MSCNTIANTLKQAYYNAYSQYCENLYILVPLFIKNIVDCICHYLKSKIKKQTKTITKLTKQ